MKHLIALVCSIEFVSCLKHFVKHFTCVLNEIVINCKVNVVSSMLLALVNRRVGN